MNGGRGTLSGAGWPERVGPLEPHAGRPVAARGAPPGTARGAAILLHGRNAGPENILELAELLPADFGFLAPAAASGTWYPASFLADTERNQPGLSSALALLDQLVRQTAELVPRRRIVVLGFSQGACLALEHAVRSEGGLGAVIGLSGGLIGPAGTTWEYPGRLAGTRVFLGCSDVDPHIPRDRVEASAREFERRGATVELRIYPGMGHLVSEAELAVVRRLLLEVAAA